MPTADQLRHPARHPHLGADAGRFFTKIDGKLHADDADSLTNVKD